MTRKKNNIIVLLIRLAALCVVVGEQLLMAGEIKPSVELEFNAFYDKNYPQSFSFQMREAILFLDANISEHSSGLIEYVLRDDLKRGELERLYFVHRELPLNSQLTLGQFRNPFGYYNAFTVTKPLTKSTPLSPGGNMPEFKLRSLDVGLLWESQTEEFSWSFAVVNGSGSNALRDDNNFKDFIGHAAVVVDRFQIGANGYYGRKNSLYADGTLNEHSAIEVTALGIEAMINLDDVVIAGEAIAQGYGELHSAGAYIMMNYNLSGITRTLRSVSKLEVFDPNRSLGEDEQVQLVQGLSYTIDRGYTLKLEYVMNIERQARRYNSMFIELEYEL
ncbi:MAG: hypothetical protein EPO24_01180 [Bacteroidetes bacterium]|nr:MAG: hypothetical protein EPO24_01180 [Bacteroidota bacterium]